MARGINGTDIFADDADRGYFIEGEGNITSQAADTSGGAMGGGGT